jgi:hypothetical protein
MTDDDLDAIEARANDATPFLLLALIAEVRRLRAERDEARRMAVALEYYADSDDPCCGVGWDDDDMPDGFLETIERWRKELSDAT